ncbi:hypothetical protein SAMN05444285_12840 [Draconibacterium orientale]|uniref:Uncharacterized protein n=1 Tax=Draconibacterium orientale TaxID=1168034 RepID=A0A1I0I342_9BACT|nr:hypothetical protein SAMN05444285_12840 [Draconibacterium orientale]
MKFDAIDMLEGRQKSEYGRNNFNTSFRTGVPDFSLQEK